MRARHLSLALVVFLFDAAKGAIPVLFFPGWSATSLDLRILGLVYGIAAIATLVAAITRVDNKMPIASVRLTHFMDDMDSSKARRDLKWTPDPVENSVRAAVRFYRDHKIRGKSR